MKNNIIKKIILFLSISAFLNANDTNMLIDKAIKKYSSSPFSTVYITGGAFYSGDDMDRLPMLVHFYISKPNTTEYMRVLDGLFGNIIFDAKVNKKTLNLLVPDWKTNIVANVNSFSISEPMLNFPKIFYDVVQYRFIDLEKQIVSTNLKISTNWNTLEIGYKDRVDTIVFSATTERVRTFSSRYKDNTLTIDLSSYTNISGIAYPREFVVKSKTDRRELRLNITNIIINQNAIQREVSKLGF